MTKELVKKLILPGDNILSKKDADLALISGVMQARNLWRREAENPLNTPEFQSQCRESEARAHSRLLELISRFETRNDERGEEQS